MASVEFVEGKLEITPVEGFVFTDETGNTFDKDFTPTSSAPRGSFAPMAVYLPGLWRKSMISTRDSLASSWPSKGIIVLAATNRPEVLDKALLRPGRFDRRVILVTGWAFFCRAAVRAWPTSW